MSKTRLDRLQDARTALGKVDGAVVRHAGKLAPDIETQFKAVAAFASNVEHWNQMLAARETARSVNEPRTASRPERRRPLRWINGKVPDGSLARRPKLPRSAMGLSGSPRRSGWPGLVRSQLLAGSQERATAGVALHRRQGAGVKTAAIAFYSLRQSFGWPIAISYALRNHFLHDGGGGDFYAGPTAASAFKISADGWARIAERVKTHKVDATHSRLGGTWTPSAGDDLRKILDTCAPEIDEALGVLVGSACELAKVHIGFMLGE